MSDIRSALLLLIFIPRWPDWLRRSRVLRPPLLQKEPALHHGGQAHQHPAAKAASSPDGLVFPEDEVHHWGGLSATLCRKFGLQRKVTKYIFALLLFVSSSSTSLSFSWLSLLLLVWLVWSTSIKISSQRFSPYLRDTNFCSIVRRLKSPQSSSYLQIPVLIRLNFHP